MRQELYFINLDRDREKLQSFCDTNRDVRGNVLWSRLPGVDGSLQDPKDLIERGLIDKGILPHYTQGNIGCSLSHIEVWNLASANDIAITVFEDDAVVYKDFLNQKSYVMAALPDFEYDVILWGWNFDAGLLIDMIPGKSRAYIQCDQAEARNNILSIPEVPVCPSPLRLLQAFGTVGYTVSPQGAARLLDMCVPLRPFGLKLAGPVPRLVTDRIIPHAGIDIAMNSAYPKLKAYVCIPPLCVTPNYKHQ
jgi:glycosyl transferase family 25